MGIVERVMSRGSGEGAFAAIAELATVADVDAAAEGYSQAMRQAYWEAKDLSLATAMAYAGCSRLLAAATDADEDRAYRLRSAAKGLMYDLASFTWPGWDEAGIDIAPSDAAAGLAAARANLAMAVELGKGDLPVSRGQWMLAAHLLTAGDHAAAADHFSEARRLADAAGASAEARLADAFIALTRLAAGTGEADDLDTAVAGLEATDDGPSLVGQVVTARSVLGV